MRVDLQLRMLANERDTNFSITTSGYLWVVKFGHQQFAGEKLTEVLDYTLGVVS